MTWTRMSKRQRSISRRRLRCECLEQRSLLAVASFFLDFFEDAGGVPGERIANDTVEVGEAFFVEIRAREHDPGVAGLAGISLDVAWDAPLLDVVEPFDPQQAVTSNLPVMVRGSLHQDKSPVLPFVLNNQVRHDVGHIAGLGGSSFSAYGIGQPIGSDGNDSNVRETMRGLSTTDDHFAWLHFRAERPGVGTLTMRQGGAGIATLPVFSLSNAHLDFQVKLLTIVDPVATATSPVTSTDHQSAASPRIEIATGSEQIQFTTTLGSEDVVSPLVRPAFPDNSKFIEVSNIGDALLTITDIHINVPDVAVASGGSPIIVQPGETTKLGLTYAPSTPNVADTAVQSFDVANGLVIISDAENAPVAAVGLRGDSTFDADTNYDGRVDLADLISFDQHFGFRTGDGAYRREIDPNGDGVINVADLRPFVTHFHLSREVPFVGPMPSSVQTSAEGEGRVGGIPSANACVAALEHLVNVPWTAQADFRSVSQVKVLAKPFIGPLPANEQSRRLVFAGNTKVITRDLKQPNQLNDDLVDVLAADVNTLPRHFAP